VVFGDSLCDNGNLYRTTIGEFPFEGPAPLFPIAFYPGGRFSNGPIWIEGFATHLNQTVPQPVVGPFPGTNFAFGGAETGTGLSQRFSPNIGEQVGIFANTVGGFAGDELIVCWGGGNDLNPVPPNPFPTPEEIVANTVTNITELHLLEARRSSSRTCRQSVPFPSFATWALQSSSTSTCWRSSTTSCSNKL
jgi:phospholipase/lecithinase/hemolysin